MIIVMTIDHTAAIIIMITIMMINCKMIMI